MDLRSGGREAGRLTSDDPHGARPETAGADLGALALEELEALGDALDLRVRGGTATLEDFGALARARRELARRAEVGRRNRSLGTGELA